jgi:predicted AlkP superfamily pyrophosphatase or phosphodiesterase
VSTAGIPTATRPGHVAMTAGFYEDPTSVAKGKQNTPKTNTYRDIMNYIYILSILVKDWRRSVNKKYLISK